MTEFKETELDERAINMAKVLSADAVEKAGSGHPGSPVSLAPVAYTLYQHFIKHDPNDPNWEGRDRFILSGGHASLTQYVQLYFSGYGVTLDDLKHFRGGADTRTPGHPEYGLTPGIEMTTGPLGQGFASAIGFAYGERFQRGLLDPETPKEESPFYHKIWAICGEGDIEEGISGEAAALAANQKLGNITVIFDANRIQIEGDTNLVLAEDVLKRFQAYGWYTDEFSFIQPDGSYKEDIEGLAEVIAKAEKAAPDQPKLIKVHSLIAWPTPGKTNDPSSHGSKLGAEAVAGLKKLLGYDPEESFHVDEEALAHARKVAERGLEAHKEWDEKFDAWRKANPDKAALGTPDVILMASGSEVQWAVDAAKTLAGEGVKARVVSMPSMEWFEEQDAEYKEAVLPASVKARVSVEAGVAMPWYKYLGSYGKPVSIEQFGLQGDGAQNMIDLGITAEHVVEAAKASIAEAEAAK